jgi:hypothetical protein
LGIFNPRRAFKKLEALGVTMPQRIDMTIYWGEGSMSFHSMYTTEIEDMIINYYFDQALLFTFVDVEIIKEWLWDTYCREPERIVVDTIKY